MSMIKRALLLVAVVALVGSALFTYTLVHSPGSAAQDCDDWADATSERVGIARELIYPAEREGQTTGSAQGDAQALYELAQEQADSDPPDEAFNLNGDLIEGFSAASLALQGGGGASPDAQIALAKAIVYNADLRIAYLVDGC